MLSVIPKTIHSLRSPPQGAIPMTKERAGRPLVDGGENAAGPQCLPDSNLSSCPFPGAPPSKKSPVNRAYDEYCRLHEAG